MFPNFSKTSPVILATFNPFLHTYSLNEKALRKHCGKRWNCSKWAISPISTMFSKQAVKSFSSHISVIVCSLFEFGTVSKWGIRNGLKYICKMLSIRTCPNVTCGKGLASKLTITWNRFSFNLFNPFPKDKFLTLPNWKSLQTTILSLMRMAESFPEG